MSHINLKVGDYIELANGAILGPLMATVNLFNCFELAPHGTPGRIAIRGHERVAWNSNGELCLNGKLPRDPSAFRVVNTMPNYSSARSLAGRHLLGLATNRSVGVPSTDQHERDMLPYIHAMNRLNRSIEKLAAEMRLASTTAVTIAEPATEEERERLRRSLEVCMSIPSEPSAELKIHRSTKSQYEIENEIPVCEKPEGGQSDFKSLYHDYAVAKRRLNEAYGRFGNVNRDYGKMASRQPPLANASAASSKMPPETLEKLYADFPTEESVARQRENEIAASMAAEGWPTPAKANVTLYSARTEADGVIRLSKWPEGYVLWYHGELVWKSWETIDRNKLYPDTVREAGEQDEIARQNRLAEEAKQAERQPLRWRVWWQGSANPRGAYIFAIDRLGRNVNQVMYAGEDNDLAHRIVDAHNRAIEAANLPNVARSPKHTESNHPAAVETVVAAYQESGE